MLLLCGRLIFLIKSHGSTAVLVSRGDNAWPLTHLDAILFTSLAGPSRTETTFWRFSWAESATALAALDGAIRRASGSNAAAFGLKANADALRTGPTSGGKADVADFSWADEGGNADRADVKAVRLEAAFVRALAGGKVVLPDDGASNAEYDDSSRVEGAGLLASSPKIRRPFSRARSFSSSPFRMLRLLKDVTSRIVLLKNTRLGLRVFFFAAVWPSGTEVSHHCQQ